MKKKSIWFAILATLFTAGGIGSYFMYWIYQVEPGMGGGNFGYEVALNFDGTNRNLLSLAGLAWLVIGFLMSLIWMFVKIGTRKKEKDPDKTSNGKAVLILIIAAFICFAPLIGASSAMEVYGVANDTYPMISPSTGELVKYGYFMGEGIPLASICGVLAGVSFFYGYSGLID